MNLKLLKKRLEEQNIDALLLFNYSHKDPNIYYLSQLDMEYLFLIMGTSVKPTIYASSLEYHRVKAQSKIKNVKQFKKSPFALFQELCKKHKWKKVGLNLSSISVNEFKAVKKNIKDVKFVDVSKVFNQVRMIKTKQELALIKEACNITDKIFSRVVTGFKKKKFKTEMDVADFIAQCTKEYGCTASFPTIVGSGPHGAMPHYEPKRVKLQKGFCVMDFGVRYKGYCSDMTRTVYLGTPSPQEVEHYELVVDAIYESRALIKQNITVNKVDEYVRKKFGKLDKFYIHALGHGLGTEVHEPPVLSVRSKEKLLDGCVFTIEPGLYFPGKYGIRVEDDYVLQNNKAIQLTQSPHDLVIIKSFK